MVWVSLKFVTVCENRLASLSDLKKIYGVPHPPFGKEKHCDEYFLISSQPFENGFSAQSISDVYPKYTIRSELLREALGRKKEKNALIPERI